MTSYWVLAYYYFTSIKEPALEVLRHKEFFSTRDIKGRIYISHDGINGQMSASPDAAEEYIEWLRSDSRFKDIEFKIHTYPEHCFPRATVKVRPQLVAMDASYDMSKTGVHVSPEQWKKMLEERDEKTVLLDVRNDYEWELGHFEGAELPTLEQFREFPTYAKKLKEKCDPQKTKVMMYCTGGIRCEVYSALLKEEGFNEVYQLQGGIIKYGLQAGSKHWKGKLFVFDDRLAVPISEKEPAETISSCIHCKEKSDLYFNCANMDCNELFISCQACAEKTKGCCCPDCEAAPRVRPLQKGERPKPFRRLSHLFSEQTNEL
ncbi:MAG: rhodanese-related sulfurtransferase [Verrucomicrobia bacterium]|nr:rhodanese-related sulfurtransferase [Verrucomicrobiota bacterium]